MASKNQQSNLLTPLVDALFDAGKSVWNMSTGNTNSIDWAKEFEYLKLCNKDEVKPRLLSVEEDKYYKRFHFSLPLGLKKEDFEKHLSRIATMFGLSDEDETLVKISRHGKGITVVLDKDVFSKEKFEFAKLDTLGVGLRVSLGYYIEGSTLKELVVDLTDPNTPHFSVSGSTGAGKSNAVKLIITQLARNNSPAELEMSLCDLKGTEFFSFENLPHIKNYTDDPEKTCAIIDELVAEMDARYKIIKQAKCTGIKTYIEKGNKMPYHLLLIDEFPELAILSDSSACDEVDPEVITKLRRLLNKGRSCGIIIGLSSQTNKATTLPTELRSNIPLTIGLKCRDEAHSKGVCGSSGLQDLRGVGMANVYGLPSKPFYTIKMFYIPEKTKQLQKLLPKPNRPVNHDKDTIDNPFLEKASCVNENVRVISGFDLDKQELFSSFAKPKPRKPRHRNSKKQKSIASKLDELD